MLIKKELPKPNLDDRTFAQLADEAVKLIPGIAPEWTDHNLSDPGIMLIELFAWLSETSLYRLNLITDRHRLKYLRILGSDRLPQMPARIDLTFDSVKATPLKKGQGIITEVSGSEICFELEEDIIVAPVKLLKIIVDEMTGGIHDRTRMNAQADQFFAVFGLNVQKDCALYLGFDKPSDTLSFTCYLYEKDLIPPGKHGNEPEYDFRNASLRWEIMTGDGVSWETVTPAKDATKDYKNSGRIVFENLNGWSPSKLYISEETCCWLRCTVSDSAFEYPPRIEKIRLNTVSAAQGKTILDVEEWTGDGLPYQKYSLKHKPVMNQSLAVSVDGNTAGERPDFDGSGPQDNHFILNCRDGEIMFGDGMRGKTPAPGSSIKVICYRICNGAEGNIGQGYVWMINRIEDIKIINHKSASGGSDPETVEDAAARFMQDLRVPYSAVTSSDFEYLAVNTPGLRIAKARALPNYHPREGELKGSVTVVVIPFTPLEFFETPPYPSQGFRHAVCRHIDRHRLLGTDLHITGPRYVKVTVSLVIDVTESFPGKDIIAEATKTLNRYLHPVLGGHDHKGWPIGRNVYRSELYEELEQVEGIACITRLSLQGEPASQDSDGNLILPSSTATVYSGKHTVSINKTQEECRKKNKDAGH